MDFENDLNGDCGEDGSIDTPLEQYELPWKISVHQLADLSIG